MYDTNSDTNEYTLDAVWASLSVNNKEKVYNKSELTFDPPTVEFDTSDDYKELLDELGITYSNVKYQLVEQNGEAVDNAEITNKASQTDVGVYRYKISADVTGKGVSATLETYATLTIKPKAVTVTADDKTKVYGTEDPELTATVEGLVGEDKVAYTVSREDGENVGTYTITPSGAKDQGNYTVTYETGTLTVINNTTDLKFVEADTKGYNGVYDGTAHDGVTSVKVTGVGEAEIAAEDMTVKYRLSDEDEWSSEMPKVTDVADTTPVQIQVTVANYEPITMTVQATVTERPVSITTESATRTYNGTALTAPGKLEGIVEGESYGFTVTGSQTLVGESQNTYTLTWAEAGNSYTAKKDNYTVTESLGTLTVTDGSEEHPIDPEDVVKKTHGAPEDGIYEAGEVVTFTVTVTNIYDQTKTITLNEIDGVTLEQAVFEGVEPGKTVSTTATYTITEADVIAGEFVNTVTASFSDEESTFEDEDIVDEIEESEDT